MVLPLQSIARLSSPLPTVRHCLRLPFHSPSWPSRQPRSKFHSHLRFCRVISQRTRAISRQQHKSTIPCFLDSVSRQQSPLSVAIDARFGTLALMSFSTLEQSAAARRSAASAAFASSWAAASLYGPEILRARASTLARTGPTCIFWRTVSLLCQEMRRLGCARNARGRLTVAPEGAVWDSMARMACWSLLSRDAERRHRTCRGRQVSTGSKEERVKGEGGVDGRKRTRAGRAPAAPRQATARRGVRRRRQRRRTARPPP